MDAITAEWIFPVSTAPLHRHAVEIENGKIHNLRPIRDNESYIPGSCLVPGFVNAHTHLAYTALRNIFDDLPFFPWIRKLTEIKYQKLSEDDVAASTRLGIYECIRSGITTVADLSDIEVSLRELSKSPLRGVFYHEIFGVEKEQAQSAWDDLRRLFPKLVDHYASSHLAIGISPHACYTNRPELIRQVAKWAGDNQIPVSFHVSESREEEEFIANRSGVIQQFLKERTADWTINGKTSVEHLEQTGIFETGPLIAHVVQVSNSDIEILSRYSVSIAHCPKSNAKFGHGIAPIVDLLDHGFVIGIGTDSACSNNRLDLLEEARFALLQQRSRYRLPVLNEQIALELITLRAANAIGLDRVIGSIEPGKEADLVLFELPPYYSSADQVLYHLIHNAGSADIKKTYISGQVVQVSEPAEEVSRLYKKLTT